MRKPYYKNLIFGASGIIGTEFINNLNIRESLFTSSKKPLTKKKIIWKKINLDTDDLYKLPRNIVLTFLGNLYR